MGIAFCLVFALAALMLLVRVIAQRPLFRDLADWSLALLPALLFWVIMQVPELPRAKGDAAVETWRATLAAARFRLWRDERVTVGGDASSDHLVVERLQPAALTLRSLEEHLEMGFAPWTWQQPGLVVVDSQKDMSRRWEVQGEPLLGGVALEVGTEWCIAGAAEACTPDSMRMRWVREGGTDVLLDADSGKRLCALPAASDRHGRSRVPIFPLAHYAREGCTGSQEFAWSQMQPAREFLYRLPDSRKLYLRPAENLQLLVRLPGAVAARIGGPDVLRLPADSGVHVSLWEIELAQRLPAGGEGDDISSIQERRSFQLRHAREQKRAVVSVLLDTPQTATLTAPRNLQMTVTSRENGLPELPRGYQTAAFGLLGAPTALQTLNLVQRPYERSDACPDVKRSLVVQNMSNVACATQGRWFMLGNHERVQLDLRLAPIAIPAGWCAAILVLALVNLLVRAFLQVDAVPRVVLGFLEMLLALRLAVAFEAAAVDARQESTVTAAWLALLWLPLAFELTLPVQRTVATNLARLCKLLVVLGATALIFDTVGVQSEAISALGIALGVAVVTAAVTRWPRLARLRAWSRCAQHLAEWRARLQPWAWAAAPLAILVLLHAALVAGSFKEQLPLVGMRISALLVPALVLAWAHLYTLQQEQGELSGTWTCAFLLTAFAPFLVFLVANDTGAVLYFFALAAWLVRDAWPARAPQWVLVALLGAAGVAAFLLLIGWIAEPLHRLRWPAAGALLILGTTALLVWRRSAPAPRLVHGAPALVVCAALIAVPLTTVLAPDLDGRRPTQQLTLEGLAPLMQFSTNGIRLLTLVAPGLVEDLGIREGYEQRAAMSEMYGYAATAAGRGWLQSRPPAALSQTHVDDTVTAVHVMSPFGRSGGLGLALLLTGFAASIWLLAAAQAPPIPVLQSSAQLSALVLVLISLYMLMSNIGLVPFTGRNFYFLAVASGSDLLEGGLLLAIIMGLRR